jgi:5'-nucleotidase
MMPRTFSKLFVLRVASLVAALLAGCTANIPATPQANGPVHVKVLAINDFHGNLKPPTGGIRVRDPQDASKTVEIPAGGAEYLATAVAEARAKNPNHIFVAAGDLVGATPLLSALFRDEPTIDALGLMGLEASAVGNHEFDHGRHELLRQQNGGCHPRDGCKGPQPFTGARFQYLAASTVDTASGKTILPPYYIKRFQGIPVAFIGLTLKATPTIVGAGGVAGLEFRDEAETVNRLVPELRRLGIEAIVVLIHEGGIPSGGYNECPNIAGPIVEIVRKFDKAVDLVVSGHTHRAYNCRIDGRLVTSADMYGRVLSEIDLTLDPRTGDVVETRAENLIVRNDRYAKDPAQTRLIAAYELLAAPLAQRVVGQLTQTLTRDENTAGEIPLGQVVADAHLAATQAPADGAAQIAFTNPGGLRAPLTRSADGQVRYEDLFSTQPFSNHLVTMTLSGEQVLRVLEQQWHNQPRQRILQVSSGFTYQWDARRPIGQRVVPGSAQLNGQPLDPAANYRVTVNSFLAGGGDNFAILRQGTALRTGAMDVDAMEQYFRKQGAVSPAAASRIVRVP